MTFPLRSLPLLLLLVVTACSEGGPSDPDSGPGTGFAPREQVEAFTPSLADAKDRILAASDLPGAADLRRLFDELAVAMQARDERRVNGSVTELRARLGVYGEGGAAAPDLDVLRLTVDRAAALAGLPLS